MAWYSKYLTVYNRPFQDVPLDTIKEVRERITAMQSDQPVVSLVVIAYNEATRLAACLWSLSNIATSYPIEILGINNNSADETEQVFKAFGVKCITEKKQSPGFARQCGIHNASGKYHFFLDADTMYPPQYVDLMMGKLTKPGVACVSSFWSFYPDDRHSKFSLTLFEFIRDAFLYFQHFNRPELCVRGMVFAFNTDYLHDIKIRTDIRRGEDGSLALELKQYGKIAFLHHRKARVMTGYGTLNEESMWQSLVKRIKIQSRALPGFFFKKNRYEDSEENLIH